MRALLLAALLTIVLIPTGLAADKWVRIQTTHFTLVGNASDGTIRRVGENLEQFREAVTRLLPKAKTESPVNTVVLVFRDDSSFTPFKPLYNGKPANVAGYFQSGSDVNYIAMRGDLEAPRVIYHEYFHQVAADTMGRLPAWFNEGFAEYYSTFEIFGKDQKAIVGKPIAEHMELLRRRSLLSPEVLFSVTHGSPYYNEEGKQGLFYAQSWATIHYILLSDGGKRRNQMTALLRQLEDGASAAESIKAAFEMDLGTFQKQVDEYINDRLTLPATEYTFANKLTVEAAAKGLPLTEAEVQFYLGDLLLHFGRREDAETYLKKSIGLDSKLASAQASLGMLRLRDGDAAEALKYLKNAAESDSKNHLIHFYYAQTLQSEGAGSPPNEERLQTIRAELKKSLALSPNFLPAVDLLAYANLTRNADLDESAVLLRGALEAAPSRDNLRLRLAEVLYRTREFKEAKTLLQRVVSSPEADSLLIDRSRSLLQAIDYAEIAQQSGLRQNPRPPAADDPLPAIAEDRSQPPVIRREDTRRNPNSDGDKEASSTALRSVDPVTGKTRVVSGSTEGEVLLGLLTAIECSEKGVTLVVNTGQASVRLHSDELDTIQFVSFTQAVKGEVECGPFPNLRVRVNYKPDPSGRTQGTPLAVAFVE